MSQQAQAQNEHERGLQGEEEINRRVDELRARRTAGEITTEALVAETALLNTAMDDVEARFDAAADLDTLNARATSLADRARTPAFSRPPVDVEAAAPLPAPDPGETVAQRPAPAETFSATPDRDMEPGGTARYLLNQYLRPTELGGGRAGLSAKGWNYLTRGRQPAGPMAELLAAHRGEQFTLTPYVDTSGGYVQAEEISREIVRLRDRAVVMESRVNKRAISGVRLTIPTMRVDIPFEKRSKAKGATVTSIDLKDILGKTALTVHPKDAMLKIPEEFFEDPEFDAVGEIAREAERSSREDDETDMLNGDGAGGPLGIVPSLLKIFAAGGTQVAQTVAGAGADVTPDEVEAFDTFLHANALSSAIYVFNRPGVRKVRLMRTEEGGQGTGDRMFKRSNIAGGLPVLLERELITSEFLPDTITSGSEGDLLWMLIDLMDYWWLVQKDLQLRILQERFADENMIGYKWKKSRDGALVRADAALYMRRNAG